MTTITHCSNGAEADLIKSVLEEADITAFVLDDAFGGAIQVQVEDEHLAEAQRLLAELRAAPAVDAKSPPSG